MEMYKANDNRYADMAYRRCGRSGLLLPVISLGLWHNFGSVDVFSNFIQIAYAAFDNGITHFDLANNYGPVYGSADIGMNLLFPQKPDMTCGLVRMATGEVASI